jgi:hypothetical protein
VKTAHADVMHRIRWRRSPVARVTREFVARYGLTVQAGPFAGMVYPRFAVGRGELVVAQLLGSYEHELAGAFEQVIAWRPDVVVDVGASDGYYAVGLARELPQAAVHAFEINPFPARVCRALAEANGVVDRIVMHGDANLEELRHLPSGRTFVLSDCEGCERTLMDPEELPWLRSAFLVVELHEFAAPGVEQTVRERFAGSHDISMIDTVCRWTAEWPALKELDGIGYMDHEVGLSEFRPQPMRWAVMSPRVS